MANKTIPQLTETSTVASNAFIAVDTGTQTFKVSIDNFAKSAAKLGRTVLWKKGNYTVPAGVTSLRVSAADLTSGRLIEQGQTFIIQKADGTLIGAGYNTDGALGDNTTVPKSSPVAVAQGMSFAPLRRNIRTNSHYFLIKPNGETYGLGYNYNGPLGVGDSTNRSSPALVGANLFEDQVVQYGITMLKGKFGEWFGAGDNGSGQLGDGTSTFQSSPVRVLTSESFATLAYGDSSWHGLNPDGKAFSWGNNLSSTGILGDGTNAYASSPIAVAGNYRFKKLVATNDNSGRCIALTKDGRAYTWGVNSAGTLGNGTPSTSQSSPVAVVGDKRFIEIYNRTAGGFGIDRDNKLWGWGGQQYGGLGVGDTLTFSFYSSPVAVAGDHQFRKIFESGETTFGLNLDNQLFAWGFSFYGMLGTGNSADTTTPTAVLVPEAIVDVYIGFNNVFARGESGTYYGWGRNQRGELGRGDRTARSSPVAVMNNFADPNPNFDIIKTKTIGVTPGQVLPALFTAAGSTFGPMGFPVCDALIIEVNR